MTDSHDENHDEMANPLDLIENVLVAIQWPVNRPSETELFTEVNGRWCGYILYFLWQEEYGGLQFHSRFDLQVPDEMMRETHHLIGIVNERLWLGHFEIEGDDSYLTFRHTALLHDASGVSPDLIDDMIDISLSECERYYSTLQFVISGHNTAEEALDASILDPVGEA